MEESVEWEKGKGLCADAGARCVRIFIISGLDGGNETAVVVGGRHNLVSGLVGI